MFYASAAPSWAAFDTLSDVASYGIVIGITTALAALFATPLRLTCACALSPITNAITSFVVRCSTRMIILMVYLLVFIVFIVETSAWFIWMVFTLPLRIVWLLGVHLLAAGWSEYAGGTNLKKSALAQRLLNMLASPIVDTAFVLDGDDDLKDWDARKFPLCRPYYGNLRVYTMKTSR